MIPVLDDFRNFQTVTGIHGIERLFVSTLLLFRMLSVSYWLRSWLPSPRGERRRLRNNTIDAYCLIQAIVLIALLVNPGKLGVSIAVYILFEVFLTLANIIFVGKFKDLQAPPASIERTIILLFLNVIHTVLAFSLFYRYALGVSVPSAIFYASLVLGTVGYPSDLQGTAQLIVSCQIILDLILIIVMLSSFVSQIGLFRRSTT
jgi:hypothetical protein